MVLITLPYICKKAMISSNKLVIGLLERKLNAYVTLTVKRAIQSKWIKTHKSQIRPRNRTLTQVHEDILDDLI